MRIQRRAIRRVVILLALALGAGSIPASAQAKVPSGSDIVAVLEERLVGLKADEATVVAELREIELQLGRAADQHASASALRDALNQERRTLVARRLELSAAHAELSAGAIVGRPTQTDRLLPKPGKETEAIMSQVFSGAALDHLRSQIKSLDQQLRALDQRLDATSQQITALSTLLEQLSSRRREATEKRDAMLERIDEVKRNIARQGSVVLRPGLSISVVVLDAHLRAARRVAAADPACGVTWWVLAAVGAAESANGAGRAIDADGDIEPIIGPVLDGQNGTAEIKDTDQGRMDLDTEFDRAVGPMQFIPTTWAVWGTDGNADKKVDPFNIYDASLSAARYLCASRDTQPLDSAGGLATAAFAYNHSLSYVGSVMRQATRFQGADFTPAREVTIASGSLHAPLLPDLVQRLTGHGWRPAVAATGRVDRLSAVLANADGVPVAVRGTLLVIADPTERVRWPDLIAAASQGTEGLRTIVILPVEHVPAALSAAAAPHVAIVPVAAPSQPPPPANEPERWADWLRRIEDVVG